MDTGIPTIKAALAKLNNGELNALVWATENIPQFAPGLLAWIVAACNWELHRRVGLDYDLQSPEAAIPPTEDAASINAAIAIQLKFGQGAGSVRALLDAVVELLTGAGQRH